MRTVNHIGPETGSRPGEDYTKHHYPRTATQADNSGKLSRILPLPLMHLPPGPLILPPQERRLPLCVLGTESQAKEPRGQLHFPMGLPEVGGSSAQADPRPHCPSRRPGGVRIADGPGVGGGGGGGVFLQAQSMPGLHFLEIRTELPRKLLCILKRMDFRFPWREWQSKRGKMWTVRLSTEYTMLLFL